MLPVDLTNLKALEEAIKKAGFDLRGSLLMIIWTPGWLPNLEKPRLPPSRVPSTPNTLEAPMATASTPIEMGGEPPVAWTMGQYDTM
eukprot:gene20830-27660_t